MLSGDLQKAVDSLPRPRAIVLGDLVLDAYSWGNADRISPEAPVLVLQVDRRETRVGGAGNVAHAFAALEGYASCIGAVGNDSEGQLLRDLMLDYGIDTELVITDPSRRTTLKERFIGRAATAHPGHILRVDTEDCTPLAEWLEDEIIAKLNRDVPHCDVLLVPDYAKGVCTQRVLTAAIQSARSAEVPILIDPVKSRDWEEYRGATALLMNRVEAELASEITIDSPGDAMSAGRKICCKYDLQTAVVTLNQDGMAVIRRDGSGGVFPTAPRHVYEITGVGDVVLALFGICIASGTHWETAAPLANLAAGLVVEQFGPTVVTKRELSETISLLARLEQTGLTADRTVKLLPAARELDALNEANRLKHRAA